MRITILATLILAPAASQALSILPDQDNRSVAVAYLSNPGANESAAPTPVFSDFDVFVGGVGIANARQSSTIGATSIAGTGGTGVDGSGDGSGSTVFDVTFQVDGLADYVLTGFVSAELGSDASVSLRGPGGALYAPVLTPGATDVLADSGTLIPGLDYRLIFSASHPDAMGIQGAGWNFNFGVTAVPEPGTGLLCAAGLLGLALFRQKIGGSERGFGATSEE